MQLRRDPQTRSVSVYVVSLLIAILAYSHFINVANYSFLTYGFSSGLVKGPQYDLIRYSRLPVLLLGAAVTLVLLVRSKNLQLYLVQNIDVFLFCGFMFWGGINAVEKVNATLYCLWTGAAFTTMLSYFYQVRKRRRTVRWWSLFQIIFWTNFVVLPLLIINLPSLGTQLGYYMAFSEQLFYPYCLLSMLISIYGTELLCNAPIYNLRNRQVAVWLQRLTIGVIFVFLFLGARRSALFAGVLISIPYMFHAVGKRYWKKLSLLLVLTTALIIAIPIVLSLMEQYALEVKTLQKISKFIDAGGDLSKESSYNEREVIWGQYWEIIREYPLVGVGAYNSAVVHYRNFFGTATAGLSTHNLFVGVLVEHGFGGLFLLLLMLLRSIAIAFQRFGIRRFMIYGFYVLIPILAVNWNEYNLVPGQVFFWSTFLLLMAPRMFMAKLVHK